MTNCSLNGNSRTERNKDKTICYVLVSVLVSNTIFLSPAELLFKWKLVSMQQA